MSDISVDQAIALLSENQQILSKQITQVVSQQNLKQLTNLLNSKFDNIETTLAAHKASIDQLNSRIVMNPIPNFVDAETPSGAINSSNPTFSLANTPVVGSVRIYVGSTSTAYGQLALQSVHYTIVNNVITFQAGFIPATGSWIRAYYRY